MTLADDLAEGIEFLYEYASVPAVYEDRDGKKTTVSVLIDYELQQYGTVADVSGMTAVISARMTELPSRPRRGDTYTVNSKVYVVDSLLRADELEHVALVA